MPNLLSYCFSIFLFLASTQTLGQEISSSDYMKSPRMPTAEDVAKAQAKVHGAMARVPIGEPQQQAMAAAMPNTESIPKPSSPALDIATIADKYKGVSRSALSIERAPDLLVMVSFSMPRETLARLADQADRAGGALVFRGLKGDSMTRMAEEIKTVIGNRNVSAIIHPPAFQQFSVTKVPAVIIARPEAGDVLENGCSQAGTFVKVSGDVSLDYALEVIEQRSRPWAETAKALRSRIVRGIN
jgi:conjugal transfer pilus assembly protein TrbC